jgi:hypothetical protein
VQPACRALAGALLTSALLAAPLAAQTNYRVTTDENFRQEPSAQGRLLGRVSAGTELAGGEERDGFVQVTLEGWIWERSVRPSTTAGYDLTVSSAGGENLRADPNGDVVARLLEGTLLTEVQRTTGWVRVRRVAWMWARSLAEQGGAAGDAGPPPAPSGTVSLDRMTLTAGARILATPDGDTLGEMRAAAPARVLTRADGWARVQVDGWVRESDLAAGTGGALVGVSAAEVRSGGRAFEGKALEWTVQYIALQTADELRRDMPAGQRYMLARGPLPEVGFVYLLLSTEQVRAIEALPPLSYLTVVGRVRTARSQYLGNPILTLEDFRVLAR